MYTRDPRLPLDPAPEPLWVGLLVAALERLERWGRTQTRGGNVAVPRLW